MMNDTQSAALWKQGLHWGIWAGYSSSVVISEFSQKKGLDEKAFRALLLTQAASSLHGARKQYGKHCAVLFHQPSCPFSMGWEGVKAINPQSQLAPAVPSPSAQEASPQSYSTHSSAFQTRSSICLRRNTQALWSRHGKRGFSSYWGATQLHTCPCGWLCRWQCWAASS